MPSADFHLEYPAALGWMRGSPTGSAWLASLPGKLAEAADQWSLRLGRPYEGSYVSLVLPATRDDGAEVVLKLQLPHPESDHEATALRTWGGAGAVRLLAHAPELHALLIERCVPGAHLATLDVDDALDVFVGLLPRLWISAGEPFTPLASEALGWATALPARWERSGRPFGRSLVDAAVDVLRELAGSQDDSVLLHQDLHADNVLSAEREPWLAIDPKPLVGERAFGIAPVVRAYELGHDRRAVRHRLDRLSDELGLDRERARGWAFGQTLAWAFEGDRVLPRHVETARWLASGTIP